MINTFKRLLMLNVLNVFIMDNRSLITAKKVHINTYKTSYYDNSISHFTAILRISTNYEFKTKLILHYYKLN